ncbi:formamidopyrimidine-DNA glycosylase isoform X1 [Iris pallida]|uniref:Formamidopyrimidine-DNA glycosylase isoform X1 n=1 Tax=Iris pallida TaxID=29817 RepID=A0AAX6FQG1_IRIPA|nr:formamidopyrimidine-DNA glycosylase isoform X1 [Iris pallida]
MPELPEVEVARRAIEESCVGKSIRRCVVADDPKVIDGVSRSVFESSLAGKTIVAALRKGKNLWLQLDSPPFPSFQFGMTGAIYIKGVAVTKYKRSAVSETDEWPSKYSKVFIELEDGLEFSFTDKRRFAKVRLLQDPKAVPPISELGPDALLEPMTVDQFVDSLGKKKIAIKPLLLDQSYISGIGNWVADEVLYQARIHPLQVAANLSKEKCESLHRCIKEVIVKAVEVGADSSEYPSNWIFHSREKKPGKAFVDGKKIEFITVGGRTSAYVPELQKLNGPKTEHKPRQSKSRKKGSDDDENGHDTEEEEHNGKSKPKKSKKAAGGTKRGRKKADRGDDDSDHEEEQPEKAAKKRTKVPEDSKKGSKAGKGNAQQQKKKQ